MRLLTHSLLASASIFFVAAAPPLMAHGGQYRGPNDVVPPNPGGGRGSGGGGAPGAPTPTTPGPAVPGAGSPVTPGLPGIGTGQPGGGTPGRAGQTGPRGHAVEDDLTRWVYWWEFNKDPFINLKRAVRTGSTPTGSDTFYMGGERRDVSTDTLAPSRDQIRRDLLPGLTRALATSDDREIVTACMIALAKVGEDANPGVVALIEGHLASHDQMVRETAALALGISGLPDALPVLVELARDSHAGREATKRSRVDERTRSFASYGLGLLAEASSSLDLKRAVLGALRPILEAPADHDRNLKVAAIQGLRLLRPGQDGDSVRADAIDCLWRYYEADLGTGERLIQAHVPSAIAALATPDGSAPYIARLIADLDVDGTRRSSELAQSAAGALGQLCTPANEHAPARAALKAYAVKGQDQQARYFALMALGQIGGLDARDFLLQRLAKGRTLDRPWAALALGVMQFEARGVPGSTSDSLVTDALHDVVRTEKSDEVLGATAIALGLAHHSDAADDLRGLLAKYRKRDEFAGYLCVALALMEDHVAKEAIRDVVATSIRRPDLMKQAAVALGKLGDKEIAGQLAGALAAPDRNLARLAALSAALGVIGDRHSVQPLLTMLFDPSLTDMSRAFAAVALGGIADRRSLPWNSPIAGGLNYRAAVETLTNQVSGILDIL